MTPSRSEVMAEAQRRDLEFRHRESTKLLNPQSHRVGMEGEVAFSEWSGIPVDLTDRPEGDGGRDFPIPWGGKIYKLDVKTVHYVGPDIPYFKVEVGMVRAALFVMYRLPGRYLAGWTTREVLLEAEKQGRVRTFGTHDVPTIYIPEGDLFPMDDLREIRRKP